MSSREHIFNPYEFGSPIREVDRFYGRQDLVKEIVNIFTRTRQNAIVLHGQRRIGKTSLLYRLYQDETLRQSYLPIVFELQGVQKPSPGGILVSLANKIAIALDLDLSLPDEAGLTADYHLFQRVILPQIYDKWKERRLLILCDEFDAMASSDKGNHPSTDALLGYLQTLVEAERQRLAFIFTVGPRLDLLSEGYQRLFKGVQAKRVGRLAEKDTCNLLIERGREGGLSYTDETLAEIWALTSGHPYLTQLIGSEIFDLLQEIEPRPASVGDVTACLDKAMEHGHGGLNWFWEGLNRGERLILTAVADLTDRHNSVTDAEIDDTLQQHILFLTETARREAYKQLLEGDFLLDGGGRRYQFAVEFIRLWILKNHPLKAAQHEDEQKSSPEARLHYQLGQQAFERGKFAEAIEYYRQALASDPHYVDALMALPPLLRDRGEVQEAIDLYEVAYTLDPSRVQEWLVGLRLDYAHQLEPEAKAETILEQAWRVLKINSEQAEARELISRIYLSRIDAYLAEDNLAEALSLAQGLAEPVPIIQDGKVAQQVREKWLNYSHKQTQQKPPQWQEAQAALSSLESVGLLDETVIAKYNEVTLSKADALLKKSGLDPTLATLKSELKLPLPAREIKSLLLDYNRRQVERQSWAEADQALTGLTELVDDEESQAARQSFYHQWGDARLVEQAFDEAIAIYQRGATKDFKPKIGQAYLDKARWSLKQHELAEAEAGYRQALAQENAEAWREQTRNDLKLYFDSFRQNRLWPQAAQALKILVGLNLAGDDEPIWQADLKLDQAGDELEQGHVEAAFQLMARLGPENRPRIKALVRDQARKKAQRGDWKTGEQALESLQKLLSKDRETTHWYANWLFLQANAFLGEDKLEEAKALCQKILNFAPAKTPLLDLLASAESPPEKEAAGLYPAVCELAAKIGLAQAQIYLSQNNLDEAVRLFEEALALPVRPEKLATNIQRQLQAFSENQWLKEDRELAQRALAAILKLDIGAQEISELLTSKDIQQAHRYFKEDQLDDAFFILNNDLKILKEADRQQVKGMVYQFSRLYAGRDHWTEAKRTLEGLWKWLTPSEDGAETIEALDTLNREWLDFTRGKHLAAKPANVSTEEIEGRIEDLVGELQVIAAGYEYAKTPELKMDTLDAWAGELIKGRLDLGDAYLAHNNLDDGTENYQKALNIPCQQLNPEEHISWSLRNYSERMLHQENWDEAQLALEKLKSLNLPAPDGRTRPDPRIDGAIQRVILAHARAYLEKDEVDNTFTQLRALPDPWPEGEIKHMILVYSHNRQGSREGWPKAIKALEELDRFLTRDHQRARDQKALNWLVAGLEQYGQFLEEAGKLTDAAKIYNQALECTRDEAKSRSSELAAHYIRVELEIAQVFLAGDPLTQAKPPVIDQAIQCYQRILSLPEHAPEHQHKINAALQQHVFEKLARARQWGRGHQLLDYLDNFYPLPANDYKTLFATWRRDLAFAEARTRLGERQLDDAFACLGRLKIWLSERHAPGVTWPETVGPVKALVYHDFCQTWLGDKEWKPATQALESLDQLISTDSEIIGWQVDALCQWGRALQQQEQLTKAIDQYQQALEKASQQQAIHPDQIEILLLETQLEQAEKFLDQHKLADAQAVYEKILEKPADYLNRADLIRQALKRYSYGLAESQPPDWEKVSQALNYLRQEPDLDNKEVFAWGQDLALRELEALLLQPNNLDRAMNRLNELERPWPLIGLKRILQDYCQRMRVGQGTWPEAVVALRRFGVALIEEDASARQWVVQQANELGDWLDKQQNSKGAEEAFELAYRLNSGKL